MTISNNCLSASRVWAIILPNLGVEVLIHHTNLTPNLRPTLGLGRRVLQKDWRASMDLIKPLGLTQGFEVWGCRGLGFNEGVGGLEFRLGPSV